MPLSVALSWAIGFWPGVLPHTEAPASLPRWGLLLCTLSILGCRRAWLCPGKIGCFPGRRPQGGACRALRRGHPQEESAKYAHHQSVGPQGPETAD